MAVETLIFAIWEGGIRFLLHLNPLTFNGGETVICRKSLHQNLSEIGLVTARIFCKYLIITCLYFCLKFGIGGAK